MRMAVYCNNTACRWQSLWRGPALPGIVLQLVLIPVVMVGLEHAGVLRDTV